MVQLRYRDNRYIIIISNLKCFICSRNQKHCMHFHTLSNESRDDFDPTDDDPVSEDPVIDRDSDDPDELIRTDDLEWNVQDDPA